MDERVPEVILDFIFKDGLLFIAVKNIGDGPALKVSFNFDKKLMGLEGSKEVSGLPLFKNIEFLAPQNEICTYLDRSASYFGRRQPAKITVKIEYQDMKKKCYSASIKHDLGMYKEIGYLQNYQPR